MPLRRTACLLLLTSLLSLSAQADELSDIRQLAKQGQSDTALRRVNAYLNASPQNLQAWFTKGLILAQDNRTEEAIKIFTDITRKNPSLPEPYNNLAVLYASKGEYDKARQALEAALKTNPSYATAHENLGDIYAHMASEAYDKALQLDKRNSRTQTKLSLISELAPVSGKPVTLAAGPSKEEAATPAESKTETSVLPIRPAGVSKQTANTLETKPAESKQPEKPVDRKPVIAAAEPDQAKADKPQQGAATKPATSPTVSNKQIEDDVAAAVKRWARAWSAQDVDQYLASYADDFDPDGDESRSEWEQTRRKRVSSPARIDVGLSNLHVALEGEKAAKVKFRQSYRTGRTTLRTDKVLIMKKADGKWLIQQELTDR